MARTTLQSERCSFGLVRMMRNGLTCEQSRLSGRAHARAVSLAPMRPPSFSAPPSLSAFSPLSRALPRPRDLAFLLCPSSLSASSSSLLVSFSPSPPCSRPPSLPLPPLRLFSFRSRYHFLPLSASSPLSLPLPLLLCVSDPLPLLLCMSERGPALVVPRWTLSRCCALNCGAFTPRLYVMASRGEGATCIAFKEAPTTDDYGRASPGVVRSSHTRSCAWVWALGTSRVPCAVPSPCASLRCYRVPCLRC